MRDRILIVDDHRLVAVALSVALGVQGYDVQVSPSPDAAAVLDLAERFRPSCVLLDLHLGSAGASGIKLIAPLRALGAAVLLLTSERDELILAACLEVGALGWIAKDAEFESVGKAVESAVRGEPLLGKAITEDLLVRLREYRRQVHEVSSPFEQLTPRERVVLSLLMDGKTAEEIAESETVSVPTVRTQIHSMLQKLGVHSQLAAVAQARRAGWQICNPNDTTVHQF